MNRSIVPFWVASILRPNLFAKRCRKKLTSCGISERRLRSDGSSSGKTFGREKRSERKRPAATHSSRLRFVGTIIRTSNTAGLDRAPGSLIGRVLYVRHLAKDRYLNRLQAVITKRVTICIGEPVVAANHQHKLVPPVLECVRFRAPVAKPEVSHRVHVCRRFALRMALPKAEQTPLPIIIKRSRTLWVCTLRKHGNPSLIH
jgi:hypothetical protein